MARYTVETPAGTKRRTLYGKTRGEVRDKLAKALAERADGLVFDDENKTVGEYVTRWLEDSAKGGLAHRTYANYKLQLRPHIVPAIGRVKLAKLNPAHVQGLYAAKLREGLKPSSVRCIHSVLRRSLEQAVRWNLIPRNPAAFVDPDGCCAGCVPESEHLWYGGESIGKRSGLRWSSGLEDPRSKRTRSGSAGSPWRPSSMPTKNRNGL